MKISLPALSLVAAAVLGSASAFAPSRRKAFVSQTALNAEWNRQSFLATVGASAASLFFAPGAANAAKYGGFGAGSPEVLDPKEADIDMDILKSDAVQKALGRVKDYKSVVTNLQAALDQDPQYNVRPTIVKELDFAGLRETLNTLNTAFDEDTQRGTDRLIRIIMQDITELEVANKQKEGVSRSPRRLEIMKGKLAKLQQAFDDYIAFAG